MKFPTGGKARKPFWQIRCNSEADGTVRMKEECKLSCILRPRFLRGFSFSLIKKGKICMQKKNLIRGLAVSAVMGALGFVLMLLEFPLPFIIPAFIKLDFSEISAIITAFAFGPQYGVLVCLIKNLLHLPFTSSAGVGELSNFLLGAVFTGTAGLVYSLHKSRKNALIGAVTGSLAMAVISVATNYFVVYPAYVVLYNMPLDAIISMYKAILPSADTLIKDLLIFNLPFTFLKGIIDSAVCFAVYKRISPVLKLSRSERAKN